MMIKGRSALESLTMFGLANDGPLNKGGLALQGVTTADKLVPTPKPMTAKERKADANSLTETTRTNDANKKALRDAKYKEAHAEALKAKARERMAKKRAKGKA